MRFNCTAMSRLLSTLCRPARAAGLVVILAALGLATSAFAQPFENGQTRFLDGIVAVVNDDVITHSELEGAVARVRQQLAGQRLPAADVLRRQVLERLILRELQLQIAARNGIEADELTVSRTIQRIASENGINQDQLAAALEEDGITLGQFRAEMRKEITVERLRKVAIEDRIMVTEQEIESFLANQDARGGEAEEYRIGHILIGLSPSASPMDVRLAQGRASQVVAVLERGADFAELALRVSDGRQALEGGDLGFVQLAQLPTLFSDAVKELSPGEITPILRSPAGFHILKLHDVRGANVAVKTRVRHILMRGGNARERLIEIRRRIAAGASFAELAREFSQDTGSAGNGGELGWVSQDALDARFEQVMQRIPPNVVSPPFQTSFGWHILEVLEREIQEKTLEERRAEARQLLKERKVNEELDLWLRQLRDEAYVDVRVGEPDREQTIEG